MQNYHQDDTVYLNNRIAEKDKYIAKLQNDVREVSQVNKQLVDAANNLLTLVCIVLVHQGQNISTVDNTCYKIDIPDETLKTTQITKDTSVAAHRNNDGGLSIVMTQTKTTLSDFTECLPEDMNNETI